MTQENEMEQDKGASLVYPEGLRVLPNIGLRVETGPVMFGDDWPGVFIRGDDAAYNAWCLRIVLDGGDEAHPIYRRVVENLATRLESCIVMPAQAGEAQPDEPDPLDKFAKWLNGCSKDGRKLQEAAAMFGLKIVQSDD